MVEDFPVYDSSGDSIHFLVPIMIFYGLVTVGNIGSANPALYPYCWTKVRAGSFFPDDFPSTYILLDCDFVAFDFGLQV